MKHNRRYGPDLLQIRLAMIAIICMPWSLMICQDHKVMAYGDSKGLTQKYVYSLHQDTMGYLWVGTGEGLARFDGNSFQVFTSADSLCEDFISCSHINGTDAWYGHSNGGISHYDSNGFSKVVRGEQGTGSITDIKSWGDVTWASTQSGGIWQITGDHQARLLNDPDAPVMIFSFEFLSSTDVAIASLDGVFIFSVNSETGNLKFLAALDGIPETKIQDLILSKDKHTLYILTQDEGIFVYDIKHLARKAEALGIDMEAGIESPQQILEDRDGNLWIPTFGDGVFKLSPDHQGVFKTWTVYNEENGLPGNNVKFIFQDREESIWMGMYGNGLVRLMEEAYRYYSFDEDEVGNNVHSLFATEDLLWFGTEEGLIRYQRNGKAVRYMAGGEFGIPNDRITAVSGTENGALWIGTRQSGVFHLPKSGDTFRKVPISSGSLENAISAIQYRDTLLWIATGKGVCKFNTGTGEIDWFTINSAGLPHNTVNYLQVDDAGRVWLSTLSNTVSYIENDEVTRIIIPEVGGALNIRSITKDSEGHIWVGTYGNGVFHMEGDSATNYTAADGLLSNYCYALVGDDQNFMWVSHRGGLSRIRLSDEFVSNVKDEAGIDLGTEFNQNAVFKDENGVLWFGSTSGVLEYNPNLEKLHPMPPAVSIVSVLVDNSEVALDDIIHLPPGRHDVSIRYAGIHLKNQNAVSYSYMMEGLINTWSTGSDENEVTFTKLPDGRYAFMLIATSGEGISNKVPLTLHIHIAKPFWKRWWFYASIVMLAAGGFISYVKGRENKLRVEKQLLEKAVRERTLEVVKQKEEIERQNEAIQEKSDQIRLINQDITDSIHYARRIQQAVFPPPEKLADFFRDNFIMILPRSIVSGDFYWFAEQDGKQIVTVADCTGHGVPGAFMSVLGITLLNEIVNNKRCVEADQILDNLKSSIIQALVQKGANETAFDGMDMALIVFDPASSTLQFAGGINPMVLIRNGELFRYGGDPMPIGVGAISGSKFTKREMEMRNGDQIYLYSDGYEDQFGGEEDKKFSRKRFRELLLEIHGMPMKLQKETLEKRLEAWIDGREQIDDITVMGIQF